MRRLAIILAGVFVIGTAAIADNQPDGCVTKLKGLTTQQVEKINKLEEQHQQVMDGLRTERRSTTNVMEKDKIRAKMLAQKEAHHLQLKDVLTAEQWAEFESLHQAGYGNGQGRYASNNRNGGGRGNGSGSGHHSGNGGCKNSGRGNGNGNHSNSNYQNKSHNYNGCLRASNTSSVDTSLYHAENFNIIEL